MSRDRLRHSHSHVHFVALHDDAAWSVSEAKIVHEHSHSHVTKDYMTTRTVVHHNAHYHDAEHSIRADGLASGRAPRADRGDRR